MLSKYAFLIRKHMDALQNGNISEERYTEIMKALKIELEENWSITTDQWYELQDLAVII